MLTLLRISNVVLLFAMVICIAGTLPGLIVFLPIVGGAWVINLMALTRSTPAQAGSNESMHPNQSGVSRLLASRPRRTRGELRDLITRTAPGSLLKLQPARRRRRARTAISPARAPGGGVTIQATRRLGADAERSGAAPVSGDRSLRHPRPAHRNDGKAHPMNPARPSFPFSISAEAQTSQ